MSIWPSKNGSCGVGDRVKPLKGAARSRDGNLWLVKQGANEASLDSWGTS
jgi:hypothetical protein